MIREFSSTPKAVDVRFSRPVTGEELMEAADLIAELPSWGLLKTKRHKHGITYYRVGQQSDHSSAIVYIVPIDKTVYTEADLHIWSTLT